MLTNFHTVFFEYSIKAIEQQKNMPTMCSCTAGLVDCRCEFSDLDGRRCRCVQQQTIDENQQILRHCRCTDMESKLWVSIQFKQVEGEKRFEKLFTKTFKKKFQYYRHNDYNICSKQNFEVHVFVHMSIYHSLKHQKCFGKVVIRIYHSIRI